MSSRTPVFASSLLLIAALCCPLAIAQTVWHVDDDAPDDPGHGDVSVSDPLEDGSADHPFDAIQEGIDAAQPGDEVLIADGTYAGLGNRDLDFAGKAITVRSASGDPETCIIDCQAAGRGFYFHRGETIATTLTGLTIRNGRAGSGGGLYFRGACSPTISNCIISDNVSTYGGGVRSASFSSPRFDHCIIRHNSIYEDLADALGGGVLCDQSNATFTNCTITGNYTPDYGGGVACIHGNPMFYNCIISGNRCGSGGGVFCSFSSSSFYNCVISGNSARDGGGVGCSVGNPVFNNCTICGNETVAPGGGVTCWEFTSEPTLDNCILWDNKPQNLYVERGHPVTTYCDIQGGAGQSWFGESNISADPLFVRNPSDGGDGWGDDPNTPNFDESANDDFGDLRFLPGSPCIDAGNNDRVPPDTFDFDNDGDTAEPLPFDLNGLPRFVDDLGMIDRGAPGQTGMPVVDMGAYEFQGQTCRGDLNGDYLVNLDDLAQLLGHYGMTAGALYPDGDFNADGDVDLADLAELLGRYGAPCP